MPVIKCERSKLSVRKGEGETPCLSEDNPGSTTSP
jgi:hypothetical protein